VFFFFFKVQKHLLQGTIKYPTPILVDTRVCVCVYVHGGDTRLPRGNQYM